METNQKQGSNMDEQTYRYFCIGLKMAMADKGYETDTEFSSGIMHNVSFSNAMNPNNPTMMSEKNRLRFAKRLGMDINDIINLGRVSDGEEELPSSPKKDLSIFPEWNPEDLFSLSPWELIDEVEQYSNSISDAFDLYARMISDRVRMLAKERNRLLGELQQHKAILESMTDAVKIQTCDRTVTYANRAFNRLINDDIVGECCPGYCTNGENCYVDEVCSTGHPVSDIRKFRERWYGIRATPIFGNSGSVDKVVTVLRDITEEHTAAINGEVKGA